MNILAVAGELDATIAQIRMVQPLQALCHSDGWDLRLRPMHQCDDFDFAWADVLVLQRGVSARATRHIERMRAGGGRAVYELDDLLTDLPPHVVGHAGGRRLAPWVRRALAAADVVSASTPRLAAQLRGVARRVEVVPNYAMPTPLRCATRNVDEPATLLLASSDRLAADCVVPAVTQALACRPGQLRVVCIGMAGEAFPADAAYVQRYPMLRPSEFAALVASLPNAIGLIPLGSTLFDACKSAIKYFDYAALGLPVLCSNVPPYSDEVIHGRTGWLVANTVPAWQAALLDLVDSPALCAQVAARARATVTSKHDLTDTVDAWRRVLRSLGERAEPAPRPGAVRVAASRLITRLREANRQRLARRRARA